MRYFKDRDTLRYDKTKCIGCGLCVKVCPHGVFEIRNKKAVLVDETACMECGACMMNCKPDALVVDAGVGCAAAVINGLLNGTEPNCDCGD